MRQKNFWPPKLFREAAGDKQAGCPLFAAAVIDTCNRKARLLRQNARVSSNPLFPSLMQKLPDLSAGPVFETMIRLSAPTGARGIPFYFKQLSWGKLSFRLIFHGKPAYSIYSAESIEFSVLQWILFPQNQNLLAPSLEKHALGISAQVPSLPGAAVKLNIDFTNGFLCRYDSSLAGNAVSYWPPPAALSPQIVCCYSSPT